MKLSGLHLLLTYRCNAECEHCFVWGSPWQTGTMTLKRLEQILEQAKDVDTIEWIYFEGGEPFLYYAMLLRGVRQAAKLGFQVGIVSNGYWATDVEDAVETLAPFAGLVQDLSISQDRYHCGECSAREAQNAIRGAEILEIPVSTIHITQPDEAVGLERVGQLPPGKWDVRYRGRAAEKLASRANLHPWDEFRDCPYEKLGNPGRVHVDPLGHVHICQGISIGNVLQTSVRDILETYDPASDPVVGALLQGGPAELVRRYQLRHSEGYADACHLCCEARSALRQHFPETLTPDQMYGVVDQH